MAAKREMTFLLAEPERKLLWAIAHRLPRWIVSDHLTVLGILGAIGTGVGYGLSSFHPGWLWLASAMLLVNWFGDSLDGTLARVRKTERPRYGYYLDHAVDAFNTAVIGVGLGFSPYILLALALVVVVLYLMLSINVYLESNVYGIFKMGYGIVGPTEVRILLILGNLGLLAVEGLPGSAGAALTDAANVVVALLAVGMGIMLATRFAANLRRLARLEPGRREEHAAAPQLEGATGE